MTRRRRIQAVFTFSKSVPQFMNDAGAFKQALTTAPGNTHVSISATDISTLETNLAALVARQAVTSRQRRGSGVARDIALDKVKVNVRHMVSIVQTAADNAPNVPASVAIIKACGLKPRKDRVVTKPDVEVRRDKNVSGMVHLISKAAAKKDHGIYVWEVSRNGRTFTQLTPSGHSKVVWQTDAAPGTKLFFRRGIITKKSDGVPEWSQTIVFIVT